MASQNNPSSPTENVSTSVSKKIYTEEERQELAEKLDQDLDDFISGLEKKSYTEGWPEDRWQEEMEKHPFFMSKAPGPGEEMSPLMQGLQQLKYDPLENTPEELATTYKNEGNFNFKCKKYRSAIINYTEGLKIRCADDDVNAQLYNNRAASNYFIKNYRSCLNDCKMALKLKNNNYSKAKLRAAQCLFELENFDLCLTFCDELLLDNSKDNIVISLRTSCVNKQKAILRNNRKQKIQLKKENDEKERILECIKQRGIKLAGTGKDGSLKSFSEVEPNFPEIALRPVHLDENGGLVWPVLFLYPEYKITDFVQEFQEDVSFVEMLSEMFSDSPDWDVEKKYVVDNLNVYFQNVHSKPQRVSCKSTLGEVLQNPTYLVHAGTPAFSILVKDSKEESFFLKDSS